MAIGTLAAIGIGLAGIGSAASAISSSSAANKASNISQQNNTANNALARDIYSQNKAALSPYMSRGNAAGDSINALLGIGGQQPSYSSGTMNPAAGYGLADGQAGLGTPYYQGALRNVGINDMPGIQNRLNYYSATNPGQLGAHGTGTTSVPNAQSAFDNYRNSTGYQFRLNQGMDALNSGWAGAGTLQSGAAMKAAQEYGQNFASNEFGNYLGYLSNQQGVGLSGANALAGVSTNYANNVQANNNNAANNAMNAALYKGANNPFANALGTIGGGILGYGG